MSNTSFAFLNKELMKLTLDDKKAGRQRIARNQPAQHENTVNTSNETNEEKNTPKY